MKIKEIGFTVYPVSSLATARPFYEGVLRLASTLVHEGNGMGWVEYDVAAGTLAIGVLHGGGDGAPAIPGQAVR